jgi:predicted nuclease of predicted toxin-antitoxin system
VRIWVDENIPFRTVLELRGMGHDVTDLRESREVGADDDTLWTRSQSEQAIFITTDKWFATRWEEPHYGVLVVRLRQPSGQKIHERVACGDSRCETGRVAWVARDYARCDSNDATRACAP